MTPTTETTVAPPKHSPASGGCTHPPSQGSVAGSIAEDRMNPILRIEIPGKPFAKQRPRMTRGGRAYTPKETVSFEQTVQQYALAAGAEAIEGPVRVRMVAVFEPAASWSKKKTDAHMWQPHIQRPDLDNCLKAILDGLNRVAFADDGQVCAFECRKMWGSKAETIVEVFRA